MLQAANACCNQPTQTHSQSRYEHVILQIGKTPSTNKHSLLQHNRDKVRSPSHKLFLTRPGPIACKKSRGLGTTSICRITQKGGGGTGKVDAWKIVILGQLAKPWRTEVAMARQ